LYSFPPEGGSKGIPGKNIKNLNGIPLLYYTLGVACEIAKPANICVSTDADEIISSVNNYGLKVPFRRPAILATDTAGTYEVILHAIDFYEKSIGSYFDRIILLQPTSPFRTSLHVEQALGLYQNDLDMVVSVKTTKSNPYFTLFEENKKGFLVPSKKGNYTRRQDCPAVYEYNGAIFIMNIKSLKKKPPSQFRHIQKFLMSAEDSIDIDTPLDFIVAQAIIENRKIQETKHGKILYSP
jgi:CMP-N,N'-diacetyllegionaminic acid synthase